MDIGDFTGRTTEPARNAFARNMKHQDFLCLEDEENSPLNHCQNGGEKADFSM